ncbi:MAG TPA: DUF4350 domain-containing protein [Thermoanaerobaculia bacterium]|nr:DUF4350 domain-containing protein [Thermoanaerobaculia bacterium]
MRVFVASLLTASLLAACHASHIQRSDASFDAIVAAPMFTGNGPRLLFDEAHHNFHRSDGRYAPFVTLMRNDGLTVTANAQPFTAASLRDHDILVIANAEGASTGAPAFTEAEIDAVAGWVEGGGALLLIADHSPFGRAADALSQRFGVAMLDAHLKDVQHSDPGPSPFFLLFTRENGLLAEHPITKGLDRIVTFGGQALRVQSPEATLLRLSPDAQIVKDRAKPDISEPVGANAAAAVALTPGRGRVVIMGEAAALTAQVLTGEPAKPFGVAELRIGMSRTDIDNKQFALNIVRWLARRL